MACEHGKQLNMISNPEYLRTPQNAFEPDPRTLGFSIHMEGGYRSKEFEDQYRAVADILLRPEVPEHIRIQFETAKNLYLYAWYVYRFYSVCKLQAFSCLELALRDRFESAILAVDKHRKKYRRGFAGLLKYAIENHHLKNENFTMWRCRAELRAQERTMLERLEEMKRTGAVEMDLEESEIEIKPEDSDHDYRAILLKNLPVLRNHFAHGSSSIDNQARGMLHVVSEIINQIYPFDLDEERP